MLWTFIHVAGGLLGKEGWGGPMLGVLLFEMRRACMRMCVHVCVRAGGRAGRRAGGGAAGGRAGAGRAVMWACMRMRAFGRAGARVRAPVCSGGGGGRGSGNSHLSGLGFIQG